MEQCIPRSPCPQRGAFMHARKVNLSLVSRPPNSASSSFGRYIRRSVLDEVRLVATVRVVGCNLQLATTRDEKLTAEYNTNERMQPNGKWHQVLALRTWGSTSCAAEGTLSTENEAHDDC